MRLISTNKYLLKCKLSPSSLCDFCNMNIESMEHLFWECQMVQNFWLEIKKFLNNKDIVINLNYRTVVFGLLNNEKRQNTNVINFIIILAKYYIYKMKLNNTVPKFEGFQRYMKYKIKIEQEIALMQNKLQKHNEKWRIFE